MGLPFSALNNPCHPPNTSPCFVEPRTLRLTLEWVPDEDYAQLLAEARSLSRLSRKHARAGREMLTTKSSGMFDWWTIDSMGQFESASVCDPKKDADVVIGSSVAYSYDRLQEYTSAQEAEEDLKCRLSAAQGNLEGPFAPHDLVGSLHEQLERARQRLKIATANLALVDRHAIGTDKLNHGVELSTRAKRLLSDAHVLYERAHQAREERRALRQVGVNPDDSGQLFRFMLESDVVGKHELLYCLNLETSQMIRLHKRNGSHSKYESHPFCLGDFNRGRWSPVAVLKRTTLPTLKDDLLGIKGFRANSEFDISVADVPVRPDIYSVLRRAEIFPGDIPRIVAHLSQTAC